MESTIVCPRSHARRASVFALVLAGCLAAVPPRATAAPTTPATPTTPAAREPASPATSATRAPAAPASPGRISVTETAPLRAIAILEDERKWSASGLGAFLKHPDAVVRARAVRAVGRLQDSTTVMALLPLVVDSSLAVRREAVFALGQISHRSGRPALLALASKPGEPLRELAVEALGKLGDTGATQVVTRALDDPAAEVRSAAAVALWRLADSTAVDPLLAHLNDADAQVRWRVLWALEKIVAPGKIVLRSALQMSDPDVLVRAHAARTIGRQKSVRGMVYLLNALDDPNEAVVVNALRGIQMIADSTCSGCAGTLLKSLSHAHPYVRVTAATALAERFAWVRADSATQLRLADSLRSRLHDPDAATRGAAARALLTRRGIGELAAVRPLLADSVVYVRIAVLEAFRALPAGGDPAAILAERLTTNATVFERATSAEVMGDRRDPGAAARLIAALADTSVLVVASCASALGVLGDTASVAVLTRAYAAHANDPEPDARLSIIDAVKTLGRTKTADSLERAVPPRAASPAVHDEEFFKSPAARGAIIHTSRGDIEWSFFTAEAPQTVRNFVRLAAKGYFDGDLVHRVVPDFVIQDGDPTGTGSGGPGYTIRCEYNLLHYDAGKVGMALSGKDTGGSQWFITHSPQPHLDGRYTIFAKVVRGMDVVHQIVQGDKITRVEILP